MSRITNKNIKIGDSYTLPLEQHSISKYEAKVESLLNEVEIEKQQLLSNAQKEAQNIKTRATLAVEEANQKALEIIENAKKEAEEIKEQAILEIENAKKEAEKIKEEGYKEGFSKGTEDGHEKFISDSKEVLTNLDTIANSAKDLKDNIIKSADIDIVELVIAISKKVAIRSFDEKMLKDITMESISCLKSKEKITIIVNPQLVDKILSLSETFRTEISQLEHINIIEDSSLSCDGTIVETPLSRVDNRISAQIDEIATKLINGITDDVLQE